MCQYDTTNTCAWKPFLFCNRDVYMWLNNQYASERHITSYCQALNNASVRPHNTFPKTLQSTCGQQELPTDNYKIDDPFLSFISDSVTSIKTLHITSIRLQFLINSIEQGPPWETDNHSVVQSNLCLVRNNTHCRLHNSPPPKLTRVAHIPTKSQHPIYLTSISTLSSRLRTSTYSLYVS
jgi:hypothetical protein